MHTSQIGLPLLLLLASLPALAETPDQAYFVRCDRTTMTSSDGATTTLDLSAQEIAIEAQIDLERAAEEGIRIEGLVLDLEASRVNLDTALEIDGDLVLEAQSVTFHGADAWGRARHLTTEADVHLIPRDFEAYIRVMPNAETGETELVADILFQVEVEPRAKLPGMSKYSNVTLKRGVFSEGDAVDVTDLLRAGADR